MPVLLRCPLDRPFGDTELAVGGPGHRLFGVLVDCPDHKRRAVLLGQLAELIKLLLAVFEVRRVDDALAPRGLQARLDRLRAGRIDHQRGIGLANEPRNDLVHVARPVATGHIDIHIQHMRTILHLVLGQRADALPVFLLQQSLERPRTR